jgi:hypothetical protein
MDKTMCIFEINLLEPTNEGRIYYSPDPTLEPRILFIRSKIRWAESYGINIEGGSILLSLDQNRILRSVEFIYHQRIWKKSYIDIPKPKYAKDIQFVNAINRRVAFDMDVTAKTDENYRYVQFRFFDLEGEGDWVSLSEQCCALIVNNYLCGFFVKLKE